MVTDISLLVLAGTVAGGFVSGLTGFGTGLTALPIWLSGIVPQLASPLVVVCSLVAQLQTLPMIWHAIDFRRAMPFVLGGLFLVALPGTIAGAWLGRRLYSRLNDRRFDNAVLMLLLLSGFLLLSSAT